MSVICSTQKEADLHIQSRVHTVLTHTCKNTHEFTHTCMIHGWYVTGLHAHTFTRTRAHTRPVAPKLRLLQVYLELQSQGASVVMMYRPGVFYQGWTPGWFATQVGGGVAGGVARA